MEKKLDTDYTRMLRAWLNKSWKQHPTTQQLYNHLQSITKTITVWRTRLAGHSWRSKNKLVSDILLWTPSHGRAKAEQPARTYIQQLYADTGCSLEDLPGPMDGKDGWQERVREICAGDVTWWWWWWCGWYICLQWLKYRLDNANVYITVTSHFIKYIHWRKFHENI